MAHKWSHLVINIGLDLIDIVARQDWYARTLLAEISLGARLQARVATHVLKSTDIGEQGLDIRNNNKNRQEEEKHSH